jgi:CheY-like chemotaxis protein
MNLAVNARDAMPANGKLTIETEVVQFDEANIAQHPSLTPGSYVRLAVKDSGIGMDEATRVQIFEPFFTTKAPGKGTGLGLSTVYGIVQQSGGSIGVTSEPGCGSTFEIYFPRAEDIAAREQLPSTGTLPSGTETILVVEDYPALGRFAKRILQMAGYTVLLATSGEQALSLLHRHYGPVHLLLTDVVMPGAGGPELASRIVAARPGIKVVYTSGYTDEALQRHGVVADAAHFLAKPYTSQALARTVRAMLDAPAATP